LKTRSFCCALAVIGLLSALAGAQAATINVTNLNNSGAGSLRQAIASANSGDTIQVFLLGTINLTSGLTIDKSLNITGTGRTLIVARASGAPNFRVLTITAGTVDIRSLTISNGRCASNEFGGGGISISSAANVFLSYVTVSDNDANGYTGGGIDNNGGTVSLFDCTISGNQATIGGGLANNGGAGAPTMTLTNCTVVNNTASNTSTTAGGAGGIDNFNGILTVRNSTIAGNSATTNAASGGGGGISNTSAGETSTVHLGNTIVSGNASNQLGPDLRGAFISDGYNLIRIKDGSTGLGSAGDQLGTASAPVNADLGSLRDNGGPVDTRAPSSTSAAIDQGKTMGAANDARGRARPYDNPAIPNVAGGDGSDIGAVELQAPTVVTNLNDSGPGSLREAVTKPKVLSGDTITFASNLTGTIYLTSGELLPQESITIDGPGQTVVTVARSFAAGTPNFRIFDIAQNVTVTISGLAISNGNSSGQGGGGGGGILNAGTLVVRDCTIQDNFTAGGAGIANSGTLTITRCSFGRNNSPGSVGGGLSNSSPTNGTATATVTASTFFDNVSANGGGIYNDSILSLTNCTLSGNTASGDGGGIYNNGGNVTLLNCTVANNSGSSTNSGNGGGGIGNFTGGAVHIGNTIIAGNTHTQGGRDLFGAFNSDGYNLIRVKEDSTGFTDGVNHDLVGTASSPRNAFLGQLQLYGGTTTTVSLGSSSPAINAGNDATAPNRDQRGFVRAGQSDIGAFEFNGTQPNTLANISTRAFVQPGDNVLIGGFIVTGTVQKKVVLLGVGPSLNVPGKLGDPILELYDSANHQIIANDDWKNAPNKQDIIDSTVFPTNDSESAILINLNPGGYTAILKGAGNSSGIGVVQVYDLDRTVNSKLANISSRSFVQAGDDVMIGGFIVLGPDSQKVIIRALGPTVPVPGNMTDPTLELRDVNGNLLEANDNWQQSANKQAILDSGIPPTNDSESAIVRTLTPANYTAIVRGPNGVAVVEIYALN
jgi:hypothetical protein